MGQKGATKWAGAAMLAMLLAFPFFGRAQQNTEKWGISAAVLYGYNWAHAGEVYNLKSHIYGGTVGFRFQTANRCQWHRIFNHPAWGVDFLYINYGKPNILGAVYGVLPYIEFPIFKIGSTKLNIKAATGLGYITQPFNVKANVVNNTIGSHLNANMALHGIINIPLSQKSELRLIGGLTHFSNGNFRLPNLGMNSPNIQIGYSYYFGKKVVDKELPPTSDTAKHKYFISLAFGRKYTDYIFPYAIIAGIFRFNYEHSLSPKNKLTGGLDLFYDRGNFYTDNRTGQALKGKFADALEIAVKGGHILQIGRLGLITEVACYLYNKNKVKGPVYQRVGLRYTINTDFSVYTALKVHIFRADYFEWGVSYRLFKK